MIFIIYINEKEFWRDIIRQTNNIRRKQTVKDGKFYLVPLPKPLEPTPYEPLKPVPKPRRRKKAPINLPRNVNRVVTENVEKIKKLINEITPYYPREAIIKFNENLKFIQRITQKDKALKNHALSFEATIANIHDPSIQFITTRKIIKETLESLIGEERKGLKFNIALKVRLRKETEDEIIYREPYFFSHMMTVTNKEEILEKIELAEEEILLRIAKWLSEGSLFVIDKILNHYFNVASYIPLKGNSYLPLPVELRNSKKGLINIKNEDDKCFLWSHIRHLKPANTHPERIKITDKAFVKELD